MTNTKVALFISIYRILVKGKKHYAGPSVDKLIELLAARHNTSVRRRWLFQCLHDIENLGFIKRRTRFIKDDEGLYKQIPSLISITLKGSRKLFDLGVEGAARLSKEIMGWIKGGDKRFPDYKNKLTSPTDQRAGGEPVKLGSIFGTLPLLKEIPC